MKRILVFALLCVVGTIRAWSQEPSAPPQDANQQTATDQQTETDQADAAELRQKQSDRLHSAREVLKAALNEKSGISKSLTESAKCVIVIPSVKKFAFGFGVDYGRGAMTCRLGENFNGPWSAPSMVALEGGNFGFQIGAQATDLVMLVMNERGVDSLLRSKSKLGGDVSVAAGPIGRSFTAATDLGMRAELLSYSHTGGVFAGAALNGSSLRPDNDGNTSLYGRELTAREIVRSGEVAVPADARPLILMLDQTTNAAAASRSGEKNK
jgi:SH3 domain-containing YSC84-like protein 1